MPKTLQSCTFDMLEVQYFVFYCVYEYQKHHDQPFFCLDEYHDEFIEFTYKKILETCPQLEELFFEQLGCQHKLVEVTKHAFDSDDDSDSDDSGYLNLDTFLNVGKYCNRYDCSCYNWICDACLECQRLEERLSTVFVINKRYILEKLLAVKVQERTTNSSPGFEDFIKLVQKTKEIFEKYKVPEVVRILNGPSQFTREQEEEKYNQIQDKITELTYTFKPAFYI